MGGGGSSQNDPILFLSLTLPLNNNLVILGQLYNFIIQSYLHKSMICPMWLLWRLNELICMK